MRYFLLLWLATSAWAQTGFVQDFSVAFGPDVTINRVASGQAGATYVAGVVRRVEKYGSILSVTSQDVFLARVEQDGTVAWRKTLGGAKYDAAQGIAVDAQGNLYVTGWTESSDFPVKDAYQGAFSADSNLSYHAGFLLKLTPQGEPVYATYLRGTSSSPSGGTEGHAVAVDASGSAYVAGSTTDQSFPGMPPFNVLNSDWPTYAFVVKFAPSGRTLVYAKPFGATDRFCTGGSSCIGVGGQTRIHSIALQGERVLVGGSTTAYGLAVTTNAVQPTCGGCGAGAAAGWVALLDQAGTTLYASFLHGDIAFQSVTAGLGASVTRHVLFDSTGNLVVAGETEAQNFPVTQGALQSSVVLCTDCVSPQPPQRVTGFVARIDAISGKLVSSTLLGRESSRINGVALAPSGALWVAASKVGSSFAAGANTFQRGTDALLLLDALGTRVLSATKLPNGLVGGSFFGGGAFFEEYLLTAPSLPTEGGLLLSPTGQLWITSGQTGLVSRFTTTAQSGLSLLGIANAAGTKVTSFVVPGEVVSLYGTAIGPAQPVYAQLDSQGLLDTNLSGYRVFFDGIAAPLLYAQADQINALVPFGVAGRESARMDLVHQDRVVATRHFSVSVADPAIFRKADGTGACWNEDGTINDAQHPAAGSSILSCYVSGAGLLAPTPRDGDIVQRELPALVTPLIAYWNDFTQLQILYAGAAPQAAAGLVQINVRLPPAYVGLSRLGISVESGNLRSSPVTVYVGQL